MNATHRDVWNWLQTHGATADQVKGWDRLDGASSRAIRDWANDQPAALADAADIAFELADDVEREEAIEIAGEFRDFGR